MFKNIFKKFFIKEVNKNQINEESKEKTVEELIEENTKDKDYIVHTSFNIFMNDEELEKVEVKVVLNFETAIKEKDEITSLTKKTLEKEPSKVFLIVGDTYKDIDNIHIYNKYINEWNIFYYKK